MMQYKMFAVSALGDDAGEEQLNSYLRANRVLAVRKELVSIADRPVWCFCVETLAGDRTTAAVHRQGTRGDRTSGATP